MSIDMEFYSIIPDGRLPDCRILKEQASSMGYNLRLYDAYLAWDAYSDSMCAGWMCVDRDAPEANVVAIMPYLRVA